MLRQVKKYIKIYRLERNSYNLKDNPHENRFDPIKLT